MNTQSLRVGLILPLFVLMFVLPAFSQSFHIENLNVSPRKIAESATDDFDVVSPGINTVGINKVVYLAPREEEAAERALDTSVFVWTVDAEPSPGAAEILVSRDDLFKFRPTAGGEYLISLTITDNRQNLLGSESIRIWAAGYQGALPGNGQINCTISFCHGPNSTATPDIATPWAGTKHAGALREFMNGNVTGFFRTSCLDCHTVGSFQHNAGDNNFLDLAQQINYDVNQIPALIADAFATGNQNFDLLPLALQRISGVQCESCHGPGDMHNGDAANITGPLFDSKVCSTCHDSVSGHQNTFYQWDNSHHPFTSSSAEGHVQDTVSCQICHIAEGFVEMRIRGKSAIGPEHESRNAVTCVACHDPHSLANPHQLRTVGAFKIPLGEVFDGGMGNLCANCHNSRVSNVATTVNTSFRGAHYGPQAENFLGVGAYDWDKNYPVGVGIHYFVVEDSCVTCHMALGPQGTAFPAPVGEHTFKIHDEDTNTSTVATACAQCHPGIESVDRPPLLPQDFDGNGMAEGMQSEVRGILDNLRAELLARINGATYDAEELRIVINNNIFAGMSVDQKAALYNWNLISSDRSLGVHNGRFSMAVLQRSYLHLTGRLYKTDFPNAVMVDNDTPSPTALNLYLADGETRNGFQTFLLVVNPEPIQSADVELTLYFQDVAPFTISRTIAPNSRSTFDLHNILPANLISPSAFAMKLTSLDGVRVFAEESMYWSVNNVVRGAGTAFPAADALSNDWYFAEGSTSAGRETLLLLGNPNTQAASVQVSYLREGQSPVVKIYQVPAQRQLSIAGSADAPNSEFSLQVNSLNDVPVIANRRMFGNANGLSMKWGHAALGLPATGDHWLLAEGATHANFETFIQLANPNAFTTNMTLRFLLGSGSPVEKMESILPNSRLTINTEVRYPELLDQSGFSTEISSQNQAGIVAERTLFSRSAGFTDRSLATNVVALRQPETRWFLAEGAAGGPSQFECFVLIGNPDDADDANVDVTFLTDTGAVIETSLVVPAGQRRTVFANSHVGGGAGTVSFSTVVESTNNVGVVVERSMYWSTIPGQTRYEGHASEGIPFP